MRQRAQHSVLPCPRPPPSAGDIAHVLPVCKAPHASLCVAGGPLLELADPQQRPGGCLLRRGSQARTQGAGCLCGCPCGHQQAQTQPCRGLCWHPAPIPSARFYVPPLPRGRHWGLRCPHAGRGRPGVAHAPRTEARARRCAQRRGARNAHSRSLLGIGGSGEDAPSGRPGRTACTPRAPGRRAWP